MESDLERYRKTFFAEAAEHLAALEAAVLRLDGGAHDPAAADDAFRAAHSLKGGADAVGFPRLTQFTHSLEEVLDQCRGSRSVPRRRLDLLLEATDLLAQLVNCARGSAAEPPEVDAFTDRLRKELGATGASQWWADPEKVASHLAAAPPPAPPAAPACPVTDYVVTIAPCASALQFGLDPLLLLRELAQLGTVARVALNTDALPPLGALDPEQCHLSWQVTLRTARTAEEIADVFAFARDMIRVAVEPVPPAPGGRAAPAPEVSFSQFDAAVRRLPVPNPLRLITFLVERGALDAQQALEVLNRHQAERPTLSRLAVETGRIPVQRACQILDLLKEGDQFTAKAIELGDLTEGALGQLLLLQERRTAPLHEWLVANGVLPADRLDAELLAFRTSANGSACAEVDYSPPCEPEIPLPPGATIFNDNGAMLLDFCTEAGEHLEAADRHLLVLDGEPTNTESLNAIYRGFHTIKGVSSMLGLAAIQKLAHEAENLLNLARDGKLVLRGKALDLAFASTDCLKRQVHAIRHWAPQAGKIEPDSALPKLLADLRAVASGKPCAEPEPARPAAPAPAAPAPAQEEHPPAPAAHEPAEAHPGAPRRPATADKETVRVDKDRLDKLINTIGELVIAQSMAQQEFDELTSGSGELSLALPELSKISRDLQELSLSLRMVPLQGTFQKMTRLVRDLSRKMNKPVELELHGEETELDKTVVDQLGDPLMHMVRNAVDHGLEAPEDRAAVGKPAEGRVTLRAYHQGGSVYIELSDDGRGLNRDRILGKALEKGLVAEGQRLTDSEIYALIFAPGFSTAQTVTDVSGRGVGMDVVRRNVEALQGNILIRTQLGKGTTFTIRLPLTLAIMDGLMVGLGNDVYVLPLLSVVESFRPRPAEVRTVGGHGQVVNVRGEVVPLLRLHQLLGRDSRVSDPCRGLVVLVEDQGKKHAILVDELLGQMQAVVKSLDTNYQRVEGLAGATILGDGRVAMILDIHGLTQLHTQFGGREPIPAHAAESDIPFGELV
jgi:two-component system, chemotaxis family, sensor kinase CheA